MNHLLLFQWLLGLVGVLFGVILVALICWSIQQHRRQPYV